MSEQTGVTFTQLEALVLMTNKQAMDYLQAERYPAALSLLNQALNLLGDPHLAQGTLLAITYNNIGCYYKRTGKNKAALRYLRSALDIETQTPAEATNLAGTHLNICAILSRLNKHQKAYRHAAAALDLLSRVQPSPAYLYTLVIAFHNAGSELEYMQEYSEAMQAYHSGWQIAEKNFGSRHSLTESLQKSFNAVKNRLIDAKNTRSKAQTRWQIPSKDAHLDRTLPRLKKVNLSRSYRHASTEERTKDRTIHSPEFKRLDFRMSGSAGKTQKTTPKGLSNYYSKNAISFLSRQTTKGSIEALTRAAVTIQKWWRGRKVSVAKVILPRRKLKLSPPFPTNKPVKLRQIPTAARPPVGKASSLEQKAQSKTSSLNKPTIKSTKQSKPSSGGPLSSRNRTDRTRAAITIQKNVRMWAARKLYLSIKDAVIYIQRIYRLHKANQQLSSK